MQFKAENIKLTPEDISGCTDLDRVIEWKILIDGKITEIDNKLGYLKGQEIKSPGFIDDARWEKLISYRRVLGYLSQTLQARSGQLNRKRKWDHTDRVNSHFVEIARKTLAPETFALIISDAKNMALNDIGQPAIKET